jgi:hypothetical protein
VAGGQEITAPVLIVGCGASLRDVDFSRLVGLGYILAVKEAIWDLPFADACFGLDVPWMERKKNELATIKSPLYLAVPTNRPFPILANATYLMRVRQDRLSMNPAEISCGRNSGFGAINLAIHKGAKLIYLFGYDYTPNSYYCPERYTHKKKEHEDHWPLWATVIDGIKDQLDKLGVTVINASPQSTIRTFQKVTIEKALSDLDRLRSERIRRVQCSPVHA